MRFTSALVAGALAVGASAAGKNYLGFNSGATLPDRSAKFKKDFEAEFKAAQGLIGAPGTFNSVRLYTNIQAYSKDDPIEAFEAAIDTKTSMLLGVWTSGTDNIDKEISALKKAVSKYGSKFTDLVIGISIGSEDLYRNSATGVKNKAGVGAQPETIVGFIKDFKKAFADNALSKVPVGHVDTWDVWGNATNKPVLDAIDWIGVDEYPYYENDKGNDIKNSGHLFDKAYDATIAAANGKPVWVTETGWPYTGPKWDEAVASVDNAKYYWDEVGCRKLFNKTPTFWYTLRDSNPDNKMKFAITDNLSTKPRFNLTCPTTFDTKDETSTVSSGTSTATGTSGSGSATGMPSASATSGSNGSGSGGSNGSSSNSASAAAATQTGAAASQKGSGAAFAGAAVMVGAFALF
ncbi:glucan 1,3-beta-glucosidase [Purpureocillium lavendulum]|uniref:Glucan 1,3-beta-glucosidase n=1 Tax=Purpureocillium lavendulum TaxID=1247861 RepID=A0AB34FNZ0_9HYPO|nr:glucan 1,3-beta-glucosidase [Purpureocillium lavendulum]